MNKKLAFVGGGYVGLVSAACFASKGYQVTLIEHDSSRIDRLKKGEAPFYEPGLEALVEQCIKLNTLAFTSSIEDAFKEASPDLIFLCVGTPSLADGSIDLSDVYQAAAEIGKNVCNDITVVNKSTVPVDTASAVEDIISRELAMRGKDISLCVLSNPEFLREGSSINDFMEPDRVVIGAKSRADAAVLVEIYRSFIDNQEKILCMDRASAELTKYAANSMLAVKISFMNEIARLADAAGADIEMIKKGISLDNRIGSAFLNAGIGYGGSCLPKDVKGLVSIGKANGSPMSLVQTADAINKEQPQWFIEKIKRHYHGNLAGKKIGIWGLAFKPETDDIRSAPSLEIIDHLVSLRAEVSVFDPKAMDNFKTMFPEITYCKSPEEVVEQSDTLLLLTEWDIFRCVDLKIFAKLGDKIVFDGRNVYKKEDLAEHNVALVNVGQNSFVSNWLKEGLRLEIKEASL